MSVQRLMALLVHATEPAIKHSNHIFHNSIAFSLVPHWISTKVNVGGPYMGGECGGTLQGRRMWGDLTGVEKGSTQFH